MTLDANQSPKNARNIRVLNEETGEEIGWISESELAVLQDELEEECPDDNDYWINPDIIDSLEQRSDATAHLVALLRAAVRGNPDGIDILLQSPGQPAMPLCRIGHEKPDRA